MHTFNWVIFFCSKVWLSDTAVDCARNDATVESKSLICDPNLATFAPRDVNCSGTLTSSGALATCCLTLASPACNTDTWYCENNVI